MLCTHCLRLRAPSSFSPPPSSLLTHQFQFQFQHRPQPLRQRPISSKSTSPATTTSPTTATQPPKPKPKPTPPTPTSSTLAGQPLKHLSHLLSRPDPLALPDADYPPWLWTCLPSPSSSTSQTVSATGDLFSKSAKLRRAAAKRLRAKGEGKGEEEVPVQRQSGDLQGREGREAVTRGMRGERRGRIKEGNFLRGM
ncbi:hypothetical protein FGG08_004577 [Glutinoglossum americanum]|uniref:Large ribosomal subunit protein mL54 n=1 Tax=Glutinoglossum americanum TaxID=1670608 RepID=A0A9P8KWX5_9PEZI|nr:hypothetical protein FGG08_004577 [Glutinoglossum americanum]